VRRLEEVLFNALGPLVSNRVHPVVVPQEATYPCLRYATVGASPENSLCGGSGLVRSHVQIDIFSPEFAVVRQLREAVVEAMLSLPLENILTLEQDVFEQEGKLFRRMLQYSIAEQEGA
jgi:hypothetical protein